MSRVVKDFNKEISLYPIYALHDNGRLERVYEINSIHDYNHCEYELHHYIKFQNYTNNTDWYKERGIKQKLILMRKAAHQHLENPIYSLDEDTFFKKYHIKKSEILFNRKTYNTNTITEIPDTSAVMCCQNCAYNFCGICVGKSIKEMQEVSPDFRCENWETNTHA